MKLCIPVLEDKGLDSRISEHFGSSPFFLLFDSESKAANCIANSNQHHSHGQCQPMHVLAGYKPNAVVCRGMGQGAVAKLNAAGIKTYLGKGQTARELIDEFTAGRLPVLTPDKACAHHGHC